MAEAPEFKQLALLKKLETYSIHGTDRKPEEDQPAEQQKSETLIEPKPSLRHLTEAANILRSPVELPGQEKKLQWTELSSQVEDFNSTLDLSEKIRDVVREYVGQKIPQLKSTISSISELSDKALLNGITHNWFEDIYQEMPQVEGQRREVLLTAMASIVKRMETKVYKDIISATDKSGLEKLGIDSNTRDLLVEMLDISMKADPLFVRFLAFSQLSGEPGKGATGTAFTLPEEEGKFTLHQMFPKETQMLSMRFRDNAEKSLMWSHLPGADTFRQYLTSLSKYYGETDPAKAAVHQKEFTKLYAQSVQEGFPIVLTPSLEQYVKEPYYEPDLKVSLRVSETSGEDKEFRQSYQRLQKAMSESLSAFGLEKYSKKIQGDLVRVLVSLGAFGSNLTSGTVAQEDPVTALFLNEQIRTYDKDFPGFMDSLITNSDEVFGKLDETQRKKLRESMSRLESIMHEFSHPIVNYKSKEAKRMGKEPLTVIEEVKAEILHKALIPTIIEKGGLEGTKEQWALATLTSTCQMLKDMPAGDPYFSAAVYSLNSLFESGAIIFEDNKITVQDFDKFYGQLQIKAQEVLSLYSDDSMTEAKAKKWIKKECKPNEIVNKLIISLTE